MSKLTHSQILGPLASCSHRLPWEPGNAGLLPTGIPQRTKVIGVSPQGPFDFRENQPKFLCLTHSHGNYHPGWGWRGVLPASEKPSSHVHVGTGPRRVALPPAQGMH